MESLALALNEIEWSGLRHAYGAATDVPALLYSATLGDDTVRLDAWWELWGNIHHQGTVYQATVPATAFIGAIAASDGHPDRIESISFLRQIAIGDGTFAAQVRQEVQHNAEKLLQGWESQPDLVQRALLLLASAFPELAQTYPRLAARLPDDLRATWDELLAVGGYPTRLVVSDDPTVVDDDAMDRQDALERWALAGWSEAG